LKVKNALRKVVGKFLECGFGAVWFVDIKEKLPAAIPSDTPDIYESTVSEIVLSQQVFPIVQLRCLLVRGETIRGRFFRGVVILRNQENPVLASSSRRLESIIAKRGWPSLFPCRPEKVPALVPDLQPKNHKNASRAAENAYFISGEHTLLVGICGNQNLNHCRDNRLVICRDYSQVLHERALIAW